MPSVVEVVSCFPEYYYPQEELTDFFKRLWLGLEYDSRLLGILHRQAQIRGRHFAYPLSRYFEMPTVDERLAAYNQAAVELGTACAQRLLGKFEGVVENLAHFVWVNSSSMSLPANDAQIIPLVPLPLSIHRIPIVGLACSGGVTGISTASDFLTAHPENAALVLCVEICSVGITTVTKAPSTVVESALFGDGAAAVLMVGDKHPLAPKGKCQIKAHGSIIYPEHAGLVAGVTKIEGYHGVLKSTLPKAVGEAIEPYVRGFLQRYGLTIKDITTWAVHPGGAKILSTVCESLAIERSCLSSSYEVLNQAGNVSSASVVIALEKSLNSSSIVPGPGLMISMGPGLSVELCLFEISK